jgi:DMSO/TMAO reductase YedYZ molybdopterin-dependent catalytic subunit
MPTLNIDGRPPDQPTAKELRLQVALLASIVTVVVSLVARYALRAPLVPELLSDGLFQVIPISLVEAGVGLLGPFAKQLGLLGCIVAYFVALSAAAAASLRLFGSRRPDLTAVVLALFAWAATVFVVFPVLGAGLLGSNLRQGRAGASVWMLGVYAAFGVAMFVFSRRYLSHEPERTLASNGAQASPKPVGQVTLIGRRGVARWAFYAVLGVAGYDIARALLEPLLRLGAGRVHNGNGVFPSIDGLATEITSTPDFYDVSKNTSDPDVDVRRWQLQVTGLVQNQLAFSYDGIRGLPYIDQYATLECISNEVGGDLIGNALWRGVPLKNLLELAVLKTGVVDVVLRASDGYSDSIPLERAIAEGTILAYEMNGAPLNQTHGFPLRLIVPGIYGMKNVKWITAIEAVDFDFKGYWQRRGWDDRAEYKTMSRIDIPDGRVRGSATIAGIAFAGDRGISRVEVSTDGGRSWEKAEIKPGLSGYTWVLWRRDWTPAGRGSNVVLVRATDGRGAMQTSAHSPPIPDGASGYHARTVKAG